MTDRKSKDKFKLAPSASTIAVKAAWYDHFAKIWYEYPRRFKTDSASTPSICLRGRWLADAGFSVGQKLDVEISAKGILLKMRQSK